MFTCQSNQPLIYWVSKTNLQWLKTSQPSQEDIQCWWCKISFKLLSNKCPSEERNEVTSISDSWLGKRKCNNAGVLQCQWRATSTLWHTHWTIMQYNCTYRGPLGTRYCCSANGWMTGLTFIEWVKSVFLASLPSQCSPVLFILNRHKSHIS